MKLPLARTHILMVVLKKGPAENVYFEIALKTHCMFE